MPGFFPIDRHCSFNHAPGQLQWVVLNLYFIYNGLK